MKKIADFITKKYKLIVLVCILLLIPATIGFIKTKINYDILVYLPEDIETIKGQNILTEDFEIGAFSFVITDNMKSNDVLNLENKIRDIKGVSQVLSINDITDVSIPIEMIPDNIKDKTVKDDSTIMVVIFNKGTSDETTIAAVDQIREISNHPEKVSGMTAMVLDTMDLSEQEITMYIIIAVALCFIVLTLSTDSYLIPVFLLTNIGVAILYNLGSNILLGNISYITKAITAVLQLGVTTDFSIFLYHKYEQNKKKIKDKQQAMSNAISETFKSVIGSSLTTIAGFLALCFMDLTLGKDIGIVMAKGVLFGLLCVLTLFPGLLLLFDKWIEKTRHKSLVPKFKHLINLSINKKWIAIAIFLVLLFPAVYGNHNVNVYYKLDKSLPTNLPSSKANKELKDKFNIVSPEIILLDRDLRKDKVESLTEELKSTEGIDLVISLKASTNLPTEILPDNIQKLTESDKYQLVIINSIYEIASPELNKQITQVDKIVKKYDKKAIVAGEGPLMKDLTVIADHDFKMVNYTSIAVIFVIMMIVLKSISLPITLICAIEFAIFINMACTYFTGVELPFIASIVVGTIQLGATIDYAILMSTRYLEERQKQKDKQIAMRKTLENVVPSIFVSALCFFSATFGVAIYSKIDMIGAICTLLSRGAIISMLVVILLLPAFLLLFDKLIMKTTKNMKEVL